MMCVRAEKKLNGTYEEKKNRRGSQKLPLLLVIRSWLACPWWPVGANGGERRETRDERRETGDGRRETRDER
jgi:hypothetical protein